MQWDPVHRVTRVHTARDASRRADDSRLLRQLRGRGRRTAAVCRALAPKLKRSVALRYSGREVRLAQHVA